MNSAPSPRAPKTEKKMDASTYVTSRSLSVSLPPSLFLSLSPSLSFADNECAFVLPLWILFFFLDPSSAPHQTREPRGNLQTLWENNKNLFCSSGSSPSQKDQYICFIQNMTTSLERAVAQKKEAIEAVMDMFQKGAEVLASAVGELFPLCEAAAPVLRLALDNVHSKEVFYVKEQFLTVRNKLDVLSTQLEDIDCEIKKGRLDSQYFSVEENIRNQFRKYMDILEAKQQFREVKTRLFVEHFAKTGGEKNLFVLHDALMGTNSFGESVLDLVERYVARDRRLLEEFCVRIKELLCLGLIALLGHCALTRPQDEEDDKIQEWSGKVEEVESRMKSTIESCIAAFPEQAKLDAQHLLQEKEEDNLQNTTQQLLQLLVKKYDWVSWSVRLINHSGSSYRNWRAGERFHHVAGRNWFEVLQVNDINLVVSYSAEPRPVPRDAIRQAMEGQAKKGNAPAAVEVLEERLRGFVVHAVSRHKQSAAAWSFPDDCHYWERHKNVAVCVHSE